MAEIELNYFEKEVDQIFFARIMAVMQFPSDLEWRRKWLANFAVNSICNISKRNRALEFDILDIPEDQIDKLWKTVKGKAAVMDSIAYKNFDFLLLENGGINTVLNSVSNQGMREKASTAAAKGVVSGVIFKIIFALNEYKKCFASVNKAIFLTCDLLKGPGESNKRVFPCNETDVRAIWREYKYVSHFWAAYSIKNCPDINSSKAYKEFLQFLSIAGKLRSFAESYIPPKRKDPLISSSELWKIPNHISLPETKFSPPSLSKEQIETLENYQSPTG